MATGVGLSATLSYNVCACVSIREAWPVYGKSPCPTIMLWMMALSGEEQFIFGSSKIN